MNLITIENITKNYGDKAILDNVSIGINEGEKIGVIGINGTGKSTLLKIIAGLETEDSGKIIKGNKVRIEYLSQNPDYNFEASVLEQVFKGNSPEMKLLREYEEVLDKVNLGDINLSSKLIELQTKIDNMNLWQLESEAKTILTRLGINDFNKKIGEMSGGQRKRVALASALIAPSELLVLDEPTNHMDSETIAWMEDYLNSRKGSLLMITHDRYFLDRVTNRIIELYNGNLYSYEGNYSVYLEKKLERDEQELATQRKRENLFKKELSWIRRGAKARSTKQKARIDRFEELKSNMVEIKDEQVELSVVGSRLGNKIVELNDITKSFEREVIKDFSYILLRDDRIGIVGPNGIGKTTLMNIISGKTKADSGNLEIGETVKIGFFSQETYNMDENLRVIDYIREIGEYLPLSNGEKITASQMLERFLFTAEKQYTYIGKLSGGEKRRLYLLNVLMGAPNVLLFDEPTNDLDIATLTILEDFLDGFNGPIITVSHDRYFLDRVCNKVFSYEGNGDIKILNGNYSDYLLIQKENESTITKEISNKIEKGETLKKEKPKKEKPLKFSFKEQKEFDEIDDIIASLEDKISNLESDLVKFSTDFVKLQEVMKEKDDLTKELEEKYERWTYLNDLSERIEEQKKNK